MKKAINLIIPIIFVMNSFAQNWTEPVNVSNMEGLDNQPDITVDQNGTIHCVWAHKIESNFWKIYYSKSNDEGFVWSNPEDISLNEEKWVSNPHIISDTENNLYVSYDYDVGNPNETMIHFKTFNGLEWSEPIIISENMPESHANILVIDNNDRIYCFWYRSINNGTTFYRYLENGNWSEIFCPYPGNFYLALVEIICDDFNNLHCIGSYHNEGQSHNEDITIYIYNESNVWSSIIEISNCTIGPGKDLDLDNSNKPHIAWRQKTPMTGPGNDSTMYRYFNGISWSYPELVVEDPIEQQIALDENNQPNIFDVEKIEEGSMLVHYFKTQNNWEGYIIDESEWYAMTPRILNHNNKLFAVYRIPLLSTNGEIFFSKSDIINYLHDFNNYTLKINIYPNPFYQQVRICFELNTAGRILLRIYTIQGQLINTLINGNKQPGEYELIWNGKDLNGKEIKTGLYLIRLQSGRNILTRSVEYIK
ncbi:MAG: BNR-4 repeat-containing protein [Bacteroidales bacterium]|nr:BNR-4 repeat-containing protein [Bacteroidales bacterium]